MSEAVKCAQHPNFSGLRAPKRTPNNPDGCPVCWDFFRQHKHDLAEQAMPKRKRSAKAVDAQVRRGNTEFAVGKMNVRKDADSGDYEVMYGSRCLYVGVSEDDVYAFVTGFNEGMKFNHKDHVGDQT